MYFNYGITHYGLPVCCFAKAKNDFFKTLSVKSWGNQTGHVEPYNGCCLNLCLRNGDRFPLICTSLVLHPGVYLQNIKKLLTIHKFRINNDIFNSVYDCKYMICSVAAAAYDDAARYVCSSCCYSGCRGV